MTEILLNTLWGERYWIAGTAAGVLSAIAFWPYIFDTLRGTTRPDRACWLIWMILASISGASNLYEGATASLLFVVPQVLGTIVVFALSIRRGSGHFLSPYNVIILSVAGLGLISWAMMETAVYALAISIGVSALGGVTTVWKAYQAPNTETMSAWVILLVASLLGVYSVGGAGPLLLAYPVYLVVLYGGVLAAQYAGKLVHAADMDEAAHRARRLVVPPVRAPQVAQDTAVFARSNMPLSQARQRVRARQGIAA